MSITAVAWGRAIRAQRTALGMSQADAAEAVGVTQGTWSKWETGAALPSHHHVPRIARVLCVPASILFRYEDAA